MINQLIQKGHYTYITDLAPDVFKAKLDSIFNQKTFEFKYNLTGEFIEKYKFTATNKWTVGLTIKSFERDPAYLSGTIEQHTKGSKIEISVRPNSIFMIFGILFPVIGVASLINGLNYGDEEAVMVSSFFIVFGGLSFLFGKFLRRRLKERFEKYLELEPERKLLK